METRACEVFSRLGFVKIKSLVCREFEALRSDSRIPQCIKTNFVTNINNQVLSKCSTEESKFDAIQKLNKQLFSNGYRIYHKSRKHKRAEKNFQAKNSVIWKCDFINDSCNRQLKRLIKKYEVPVTLVNRHGDYLKQSISVPKFPPF